MIFLYKQYPIVESAACRQLTADHFDEICANTLRHSISKSSHVQAALMGILPRLAAYDRTRFSDRYYIFGKIFKITNDHTYLISPGIWALR